MVISSLQNDKIKELVSLHEKKNRDKLGQFLIEGEHLIEEAYKTQQLKEIFVLEDFDFDLFVPKTIVSEQILKKLSKQVSAPKVIGLASKKNEGPIKGNVLMLDEIQDPGNLGTIIRSAVAFNIETIVLSPNSVDVYNEKVIRSTQGLIFKVNIIRKDLFETIELLKKNKYTIISSSLDGGDEYIVHNNKYALIVGNEGAGVSQELIDVSDELYKLDMDKNVESLNVAVATSIMLYNLNRR